MLNSKKKMGKLLKHNRTVFCEDSDESDQAMATADQNTHSKPSSKFSQSRKDNQVMENGYRLRNSDDSSDEESRVPQKIKTGHYNHNEHLDMINFLIETYRISSCLSIHTWQIMARHRSARSSYSLMYEFKRTIAPNIGKFLNEVGKINEPRVLEKFRKILQHENISETAESAALLSTSAQPKTSTDQLNKVTPSTLPIKEEKESDSEQSKSSLNYTIILDSEDEEEIAASGTPRLINIPPMFNKSSSTSYLQSLLKVEPPMASSLPQPSNISPKKEDEDVQFIEAVDTTTRGDLLKVELLIESDESNDGTDVIAPKLKRSIEDEDLSAAKRRKTSVNGSASPEYPRIKQEMNLPTILVKREVTDEDDPLDELTSAEERVNPDVKKENNSEDEFPLSPKVIKQEDTRADEEELVTFMDTEMKNDSEIERAINLQDHAVSIKPVLENSFLPEFSSENSNDQSPEQKILSSEKLVRIDDKESIDVSPIRRKNSQFIGKIKVIHEARLSRMMTDPIPSTSAGLPGHGFQASEYNHLGRVEDSDSDSDGEYLRTQKPHNLSEIQINQHLSSKQQHSDFNNENKAMNVGNQKLKEKKNLKQIKATKLLEKSLHPEALSGVSDIESLVVRLRNIPEKEMQETSGEAVFVSENDIQASKSDSSGNENRRRMNVDIQKSSNFVEDAADDADSSYSEVIEIQETSNNSDGDETDIDDPGRAMWEEMYGPITVDYRSAGERVVFEEGLVMKRKFPPPPQEFSQKLLDALHKERELYKWMNHGFTLAEELAMLHYFICRPMDIQNCGGRKVFRKILDENWKVLQGRTFETLKARFRDFVRGYIHKFSLPKPILDEFLFWEWHRRMRERK